MEGLNSKIILSVNNPPSKFCTLFPEFPFPPESLGVKVKSPDVVGKVVSDSARIIVVLLILNGLPSY